MGSEAQRPVEREQRCCCMTAQDSKARSAGSCQPLGKTKQSNSKYQTSFQEYRNPSAGLCSLFAWKLACWIPPLASYFYSQTEHMISKCIHLYLPFQVVFSIQHSGYWSPGRCSHAAGWSCLLLLCSAASSPLLMLHVDAQRCHTTALAHPLRFAGLNRDKTSSSKVQIQVKVLGKNGNIKMVFLFKKPQISHQISFTDVQDCSFAADSSLLTSL